MCVCVCVYVCVCVCVCVCVKNTHASHQHTKHTQASAPKGAEAIVENKKKRKKSTDKGAEGMGSLLDFVQIVHRRRHHFCRPLPVRVFVCVFVCVCARVHIVHRRRHRLCRPLPMHVCVCVCVRHESMHIQAGG